MTSFNDVRDAKYSIFPLLTDIGVFDYSWVDQKFNAQNPESAVYKFEKAGRFLDDGRVVGRRRECVFDLPGGDHGEERFDDRGCLQLGH